MDYFEKYTLFCNEQLGFRAERKTTNAILTLINIRQTASEREQYVTLLQISEQDWTVLIIKHYMINLLYMELEA